MVLRPYRVVAQLEQRMSEIQRIVCHGNLTQPDAAPVPPSASAKSDSSDFCTENDIAPHSD